MDESKLCLYLDSNILISYIHERENASVNLINKIRQKKWACFTSSFSALEIYDFERLEAWVQAKRTKHWTYDQIMRNYSKRHGDAIGLTNEQLESVFITIRDWLSSFEGYITFKRINDDISINSETLCRKTNMSGADALHLATALHTGCNMIVTNDDDFLGLIKLLRKSEPSKYPIATRAKGFENAFNDYIKLGA